MIKGRKLVILDAAWEIGKIGAFVDEVLVEYQEHINLRDELISQIILGRLREVSMMFASSVDCSRTLPSNLWRYIYALPTELRCRIDIEMKKREILLRSRLGEVNVLKIIIKVNESSLEIRC
jgi:hypothetical protein